MGFGQRAQLVFVAAHKDWLGHDGFVVRNLDAALRADGQDRADKVLIGAHAPRDAVHDDADTVDLH